MSFMSSSIKSHFQTDVRSAMRFSPLILLTIFFNLPQKGGSCDSEMDYILDNYYDDDDSGDDSENAAAADDDNCNEVFYFKSIFRFGFALRPVYQRRVP